ncbi:MAG TPA: hypothetical protein VHN18_08245 [Micromonosporaceae bacterium]|nr:hypothetical protein [Micromonosporaceae bacterium]
MSVRLHGCERRRAAFEMRLAAVVVVGLALGGMLSGTASYGLIPAALAALLVALAWSITATVKARKPMRSVPVASAKPTDPTATPA